MKFYNFYYSKIRQQRWSFIQIL